MNPKEQKSLFQEMQDIANQIKSDVEKQLKMAFKTFDVMEHQALPSENPEGSSYQMKVQTDNKDQSNLKLSTSRRNSQSPWETVIDEFFRASSPFDNLLTPFDPSRVGFDSIQDLANSIKRDVERDLNRTFKMFDVVESHPKETDPEHTSYYMKMKTDDNGHVRVKTIKKLPGKDWETHVEEYNRGMPLEGQKTEAIQGEKMASESKGTRGERMEPEKQKGREQTTRIEEEPYKPQSTQPSA